MWSIKVTKWEEAFQTFCWHLVNCWVATPTVKQWNLIGLQIDFWINLFRLFLWNDSSSPPIHLTQKNSKLRNRYFYNDSRFSVNNGLNFNTILTESYHMNFYVLCIQTCLTLATSCLMAKCFSFIVVVTTERLYIVQFCTLQVQRYRTSNSELNIKSCTCLGMGSGSTPFPHIISSQTWLIEHVWFRHRPDERSTHAAGVPQHRDGHHDRAALYLSHAFQLHRPPAGPLFQRHAVPRPVQEWWHLLLWAQRTLRHAPHRGRSSQLPESSQLCGAVHPAGLRLHAPLLPVQDHQPWWSDAV